MGLFDFLGGADKGLKKHASRVADKRAQAPDRAESIRHLAGLKSSGAVEALLARFSFKVDPSIIDQEEKEDVFNAIVDAGVDVAHEPVRAYLRNPSRSVNWAIKILAHLVSTEELVDEILDVLAPMDVEYTRDPERKQQLIAALEDMRSPKIAPAILRFLEDVNETCRYHAVGTLLGQHAPPAEGEGAAKDENAEGPNVLVVLAARLPIEESVRVRSRIASGLADAAYTFEAGPTRESAAKALTSEFSLDREGRITRKK